MKNAGWSTRRNLTLRILRGGGSPLGVFRHIPSSGIVNGTLMSLTGWGRRNEGNIGRTDPVLGACLDAPFVREARVRRRGRAPEAFPQSDMRLCKPTWFQRGRLG